MKWTADLIEVAVARHFGWRTNLIVPNVSWGLHGLAYEADMVVVRPSGWAMEIEIKCTASDIRAEARKHHGHGYRGFRMLWFAVPSALVDADEIPSRAGVLAVADNMRVTTHRAPTVARDARKLTVGEVHRLACLGAMRVWSLKEQCQRWRDRSNRAVEYARTALAIEAGLGAENLAPRNATHLHGATPVLP